MKSDNNVEMDENIVNDVVPIDNDKSVNENLNQKECDENTAKVQALIDIDVEPILEKTNEQGGDILKLEQCDNSENNFKTNDTLEETNNNNAKDSDESQIENKKTVISDNEQCLICGQFLNNSDIIFYQGHPQNAVEEFIALTNEKLVLSAGMLHYVIFFLSILSLCMYT